MKIPLHVKIRKKTRALLYTFLGFLAQKKETQHFIDKKEIKTILIIRPNYRIGNLIFLTPLINELAKEIPEAKIDIIVGMKLAGDILQPMPNVSNVFAIPRELLYKPFKLFAFIKQIRSKKYDLALNITAGSFSSELVTLLVASKYKASFENEKTFIPLTHTIKYQNLYIHSGSRPLELLKLFTNNLPKQEVMLDIKLTPKEQQLGQQELLKQTEKKGKTIALFRNARFDKKIEDKWWLEWYEALITIDSSLIVIDILSPDIPKKLHQDMLEYQNKNLRLLGAFFRACDLYVSADTGPLHLALASQANTLALFNKTSIQIYGTLGGNNKTIDINNLSPQEVANITYAQLQKVNQ
ncbi:Lipopolysaccharide heptosyltransferase III [hydrothermal vent metagenome]|uniref:Lipopolysaccharide heptosyltransferase III n=1 Tax=hydrothermal vent metagenome TaxID=652676 RepID=A0A1W1D4V6_9ZZZZ